MAADSCTPDIVRNPVSDCFGVSLHVVGYRMFREPLVKVSFNGVISVLALISGMSRLDIFITCRF